MNREIKFRTWYADEMFYLPTLINDGMSIGFARKDEFYVDINNHHPEKSILMQYTGLKDKNGKEIYEGDIIKVWHYRDEDAPELDDTTIHEVVWGGDGEYPAFDLKPDLTDDMNDLAYMVSGGFDDDIPHHEVIGNIYENAVVYSESGIIDPELFK